MAKTLLNHHTVATKPRLHWASEAVVYRDIHGRHWTTHPQHLSHMAEIRTHFDHLCLVLRVEQQDPPTEAITWIDEDDVSVEPLPIYKGLGGFLKALPSLLWRLNAASERADAITVRLPGMIGSLLAFFCWIRGIPYSVHMVGDPDQVLKSKGFYWYERLMRLPLVAFTRFTCRHAAACAYVTEKHLQLLYPPRRGTQSIAISNIFLEADHFVAAPRAGVNKDRPVLTFCGSLAQEYKGLDVLLNSLYDLSSSGLKLNLVVMGDGIHRSKYEEQSIRLGLSDSVRFCGNVPSESVLEQFRSSDLFIMPSRTEGLPRAMIEAMAQALPCIGTNVGGIPELLDKDALVPIDNAPELSVRISEFLNDRQLYASQSMQNLKRARYFENTLIAERRYKFYKWLHQATLV